MLTERFLPVTDELIRSWRLLNEKMDIVAQGRDHETWQQVWLDLVAVFDLIATPEDYAKRGRRVREVESTTRGRWLTISWSHE